MKQNGKKAVIGILSAVMALSIGTTSVFAAGSGCGRRSAAASDKGACKYAQEDCRYTDQDHDGICDNCGRSSLSSKGKGRNFVDDDGDGICDNHSARQGKGFRGGRNK